MKMKKQDSKKTFQILILVALLACMAGVACAATDGQAAFDNGLTLFKNRAFNKARQSFAASLQANPDNAEAHFFTGLALQEEEQFSQSIPYLEEAMMLDPDYAQMSLYYIGRAYYQTEQGPLAQESLRQAVAVDPTSEIGQLAQDLSAAGLTGSGQTNKRWWLQAEMGYEYNDNLTVEQTDTVSDEADHAAIIEIGGGFKLLNQLFNGEVTYDFYQSLYSEYSQFNMQSYRVGAAASRDFDIWDLSLDYDYTYLFLDSDEFMETQSLMPAIGLSFADLYSNVSYILQTKDFLNDEDEHRNAINHSGGLDLYLLSLKMIDMMSVGIRYECEDAEDNELDYTGPVFSGSLRFTMPWGITVRSSYKYQRKQYENMTVDIGEEREDSKQTLGVTLTKKLPYRLKLKGSYKYIDSDSNAPVSDYQENTVFLSLTYSL
ncbi:MAG: surface lipoprotein assembly modifier [Candidatus Electrothrix sp. GW3-4]|uniref:surface lipoprotein assembly modifier n=1 Tax=Candidatus Electrothrix sp. GW3-4 TaxID=3126740 RepID=UPI0030D5D6AB